MIDSILKAAQEARACLRKLHEAEERTLTADYVCACLKKAACLKLMIPEDDTDDIAKLAILSIKRESSAQASLSDQTIRRQIEKYDCHQTNLVAQKKVLLIMFIERELGISLTDDEASSVKTIQDLSKLFFRHRRQE